jgi:type IV pilus assembly protein PilE
MGIISIIAIPTYTHHITRAQRLEAEVALSKAAVALEQYFIVNNSYKKIKLVDLNIANLKNYHLEIIAATDSEFTLEAQPLEQQAINDSGCGTLILHSNGEKEITGSETIEGCW